MQTVSVLMWCDYPQCAQDAQDAGMLSGQDVSNVDFWFNAFGGRKTKPVKVVMCAEHIAEMKALFMQIAKYDQRKGEVVADDDNNA